MSEELKEICGQLKNHEARLKKLEGAAEAGTLPSRKETSVKEFILSKKPKNDVQRTLAIGYFLENNESMNAFNANDLKEEFRAAKEKVPDNVNYKVFKCIQRGFMQEADEKKEGKKAWVLTRTGEEFVKANFKKGDDNG